jgi:hypothetical protein
MLTAFLVSYSIGFIGWFIIILLSIRSDLKNGYNVYLVTLVRFGVIGVLPLVNFISIMGFLLSQLIIASEDIVLFKGKK